jgi:DNA polymerase-4
MERRLAKAGIRTVEQFWNISPKHARRVWGSVEGEKFWHNLHGHHMPDGPSKASMIGHSRILDPALRIPEQSRIVARRLTIKAATRLRRKGFYATNFSLSVRTPDYGRWIAEVKISPSQDNFTFLRQLESLWTAMLSDMKPDRLKKVSVTLYGLCRQGEITPDLFDTASPSWRALQKRNETLSKVMDSLNEKYGAETLRLGVSPKTSAGFMGTKIAFSRIPDMAEFHE